MVIKRLFAHSDLDEPALFQVVVFKPLQPDYQCSNSALLNRQVHLFDVPQLLLEDLVFFLILKLVT